MSMIPRSLSCAAAAVVLALTVASAAVADSANGLAPGDVLNQETAAKAEGLLPPEILGHYKSGSYSNPIVDWPVGKYTFPPDFKASSEQNGGKFAIGEEGTVVDKTTGERPPFILGHPFPMIDPNDADAGTQVVWNYFYRTWYFGSLYAESQLNWVSPKDLERRTDVKVSFEYYDGIPVGERQPNPENFLSRALTLVASPADLHGTSSLNWRFRDPTKRDLNWTYVPALRRVRAISPANRSDGFLGSDMAQDDGPFFDGKVEDFTWKLVGETEQLRLVDPLSLAGQAQSEWLPGGGWQGDWPDIAFLGYMDKSWKGAAWAPISGALAKRSFWIVEGVPKDKYYLYGKLQLFIDKETFQGAWNRKFNWQGELLNTMQVMAFLPKAFTRPDGTVDYNQGSNMAFQCAENVKLNRATVAGIKSHPKSGFRGRAPFGQNHFDVNALARMGK